MSHEQGRLQRERDRKDTGSPLPSAPAFTHPVTTSAGKGASLA